MRLDRYLAKTRIVDLKSSDLRGAIDELLTVTGSRVGGKHRRRRILRELLDREKTMTTYLGNGVAMPHIRFKMKGVYIFAIGRCPDGLIYEGKPEYESTRIVVLLLASDKEKNYLSVLAEVARLFQEQSTVDYLLEEGDLAEFRERFLQGFSGELAKPVLKQSRFNRLFLREAQTIAREAKCTAALLFEDTVEGGIDTIRPFARMKTVRVRGGRSSGSREPTGKFDATIEIRSYSNQRLSQLRSAVLIGLTREIFGLEDRICCVGGIPGSNQFDTLAVIDVAQEFSSVLTEEEDLLPSRVAVEVIERILAIASELAVEGREGRPVGCLFVVGDSEKVDKMITPLVLNPFFGHKEEDRNVLNPFMHETIKEFSSIDGAFIIRGDGVVESAGSLIHAPGDFYLDMPSGLGARHSAASAISMASDCIAVVVSASSGQVTLFRKGVMLPLTHRGSGDHI